MSNKYRNIDMEFIRKKRTALFDLLNDKEHYNSLRWYWIGRNFQMIQSTINDSFCRRNMTSYQYHLAFKWSCELERYVNNRMLEEW